LIQKASSDAGFLLFGLRFTDHCNTNNPPWVGPQAST
jgi:hypothetical protein